MTHDSGDVTVYSLHTLLPPIRMAIRLERRKSAVGQ